MGLIDIPELVGDGCGPEVPATIKLYGSPSKAKPSTGVIEFVVTGRQPQGVSCSDARVALTRAGARTAEVMPAEESEYEIQALIAYERAGQWFRIAVPHGSAWMMNTHPEHFHPYPKLLQDKLTHMTVGWDGRLWSRPGASSARAVSPKVKPLLKGQEDAGNWRTPNVDVDVLAIRHVAGKTWIQVRVTDGHCGDGNPVTLDTGWVPAYHPEGKRPLVWFYSRGC